MASAEVESGASPGQIWHHLRSDLALEVGIALGLGTGPAVLIGRGSDGWSRVVGFEAAEADDEGENDSKDAGEAGEGNCTLKGCGAIDAHDLADPRPNHGVINHDQGCHCGISGGETCVKGKRATVAALKATFSDQKQ